MSEDTNRALGANGDRTPYIIAGKECFVRPLKAKELAEVEREAVKQFKREYLKSYRENLDLLDNIDANAMYHTEMQKVSRWDVSDLPPKTGYNPKKIVLTEEIRQWVATLFDPTQVDTILTQEQKDIYLKRMVAASLDNKLLSEEDYQKMSKSHVPKVKIPYASWWITGSLNGMLTLIWTCFSHYGVTKDEVADAMGSDEHLLIAIAHEIEQLSAPKANFG